MTRRPIPNRFQLHLLILMSSVALLAIGCGGSLYKVRPVVELPPLTGDVKSASAGGVTVRVAPMLTDEESQDLFEANLPLSGVLPIRIALDYESGVPIEMKKARFRLRDGEGREWKLLSTKQAISQILKANGVYLYNPNSRKQFETEFSAYALDLKTPMSGSDPTRQGFLFFASPGKEAVQSPTGLKLQIERLPQPVQLTLN